MIVLGSVRRRDSKVKNSRHLIPIIITDGYNKVYNSFFTVYFTNYVPFVSYI